MDLTMSADQRALREGLRDHLTGTWTADRLRAAADAPALDRKDWTGLAELGVFGLALPQSAGGMGLGLADAAIVFEELGRALVPGPLTATFLSAALLPGAATGDVVTGLDLRDPVLVAEHLDGATHVVAAAGDGLYAWPAETVEAAPAPLDPLTPVWRVLALPEEAGRRVGSAEEAASWRLRGTVLTAASQVGVAQGALELAVRYAAERVQFDRVIGSFQAVKHLLADSLVRVDLARAAVWSAAVTADGPEVGDAGEAVAAAKILADDAAAQGGRCCVQVHGGMGFTWEVLAHLYLKRAWLQETCFGGADEHALRLAGTL